MTRHLKVYCSGTAAQARRMRRAFIGLGIDSQSVEEMVARDDRHALVNLRRILADLPQLPKGDCYAVYCVFGVDYGVDTVQQERTDENRAEQAVRHIKNGAGLPLYTISEGPCLEGPMQENENAVVIVGGIGDFRTVHNGTMDFPFGNVYFMAPDTEASL